jgi:hypothetical protein
MNIVTCTPIARQRIAKHISATNVNATIEGYPLLGNEPLNMHSRQEKTVFSVKSVQSGYKKCSVGRE